jgi:hypothetical protein
MPDVGVPRADVASVILETVPPVIATAFAFWVDIVPNPLMSVFVRTTVPVKPLTEVTASVLSTFYQAVPL